jgi:hypothetical protein
VADPQRLGGERKFHVRTVAAAGSGTTPPSRGAEGHVHGSAPSGATWRQCRWPLLSRSSGQALPRQRCRPRTSPVPTSSRAIRFGGSVPPPRTPPPSQPGSRPHRDRPLPYQSCRPVARTAGAAAPPVPDVRRSWYMSSARRGSGPCRRAVGRPLRPSTRAHRSTPAHPALGPPTGAGGGAVRKL